MSIDFTAPTKTGNYDTGILGVIRANQVAIASFLDGQSITGNVAGLKRYNASSTYFEKSDGANWSEMPLGYLKLGGGVMAGYLTLYNDPQQPAHAANKNYVDGVVGGKASTSALAAYATLSGATFSGSVNVQGNLSTGGSFGASGSIYSASSMSTPGAIYAGDGTLSTQQKFYMAGGNSTTPILNFDSNAYFGFDRSVARFNFAVAGATPMQVDAATVRVNTGLAWISGDANSNYGGNFHLANTHSGGGPYMRVNISNGLEFIDAPYSNINFTFADNGGFTSRGLLYGRGGGAGLGQITVQQGGSPSGGADGDIFIIY